jgi:hypothetical protein
MRAGGYSLFIGIGRVQDLSHTTTPKYRILGKQTSVSKTFYRIDPDTGFMVRYVSDVDLFYE